MKILGVDYGRGKIGVAVGDTTTKLAEPLHVISSSKFNVQCSKLVIENNIKMIVIGLPAGKMDEEIKTFGGKLHEQTGLKVEYFDETLSTQDAQKILIESGGNRKKRKQKEDAVAAAIMLQWYLETGSGNCPY